MILVNVSDRLFPRVWLMDQTERSFVPRICCVFVFFFTATILLVMILSSFTNLAVLQET